MRFYVCSKANWKWKEKQQKKIKVFGLEGLLTFFTFFDAHKKVYTRTSFFLISFYALLHMASAGVWGAKEELITCYLCADSRLKVASLLFAYATVCFMMPFRLL